MSLPLCFSPNTEAFNDVFEWLKYDFDEKEEKELSMSVQPEVQGFNLTPTTREQEKKKDPSANEPPLL